LGNYSLRLESGRLGQERRPGKKQISGFGLSPIAVSKLKFKSGGFLCLSCCTKEISAFSKQVINKYKKSKG